MSEPLHAIGNAPSETDTETDRPGPASVLSALPEPVYALDREGRLTWWSDEFAAATGRDDELLDGRPLVDLVADRDAGAVEGALAAVLDGTATERWRAAFPDGDGHRHELAFSGAPLTDDAGTVVGAIGTAREVDSTAAAVEDKRFETILEAVDDVAFVLDRERCLRWANRRMWQAAGASREEIIGRPVADLVETRATDPEPVAAFLAAVDDILAGRRGTARIELPIHTDPLGDHVVETRLCPYAPDGDIEGVIGISRNVSESKERERELRELQAQYETVFENAQDGLFLVDVEGTEEDPEFRLVRAYRPEDGSTEVPPDADARGRSPRAVYGEEIGAQFERNYGRCLDAGETITLEEEVPMDGEMRVFQTRLTPVPVDGEVTEIVGSSRDITDRKERERDLKRQTDRLERVLETSPIGITFVDPDGTIAHVNPRAEEVLGLSESAITDRTYDDLEWKIVDEGGDPIPGDDLPFGRVMETGEPVFDYQHGIERPDGSERWLSINSAPLWSPDGEIAGVVNAIRDITERRERKRALRAERDRLSALFENARSAIVRYELDGHGCFAHDANAAFLDVFGYDREEVLGARLEELIVPPERTAGRKEVIERLRNGERVDTEVTRVTSDGPRDFHLRSVPIRSEPSCDRGYALYTDVTDRKRRERELERRRDELETFTRISALIREITRTLVDARDREEIERIVCERLANAPFYGNAWVVEEDVAGDGLIARVEVDDEGRRREITEPTEPTERCRIEEALETGEVRTFGDHDGPSSGEHPETESGRVSALAVPIVHRSTVYGVLNVDAGDPAAFSERKRDAFAVLGEVVGFAINAIRNEKLVHADAAVEFEIGIADPDLFLSAVSDRLGRTLTMEGAVSTGDGGSLCYVSVDGADPDRVGDAATDLPGVDAIRRVADHEEGVLFEFRTSDSLLNSLGECGATIVDASAESGVVDLRARGPIDVDLRSLMATFDRRFERTELVAKREVDRPVRTTHEVREELRSRLTGRQLTVLRTAFLAGYYDWPRNSTAEEVADALGVTSPTLHQHLRTAHRKLLSAFLDD